METNNPVEWTVEENFKFRLSEMTDRLLEWASRPDGVLPCNVINTLRFALSNCSQDGQRISYLLD